MIGGRPGAQVAVSLMRRILAAGLRQRLNRLAFRLLVRKCGEPPPLIRGSFTVAGTFQTPTGWGEGARLFAEALRDLNCRIDCVDLSGFFPSGDSLGWRAPHALRPSPGGTVVVHMNPPYVPHALAIIGRGRLAGRRVIGYWAWELPELPSEWLADFAYVHEIWAPSLFTANAIARNGVGMAKPLRVVPHPVQRPKPSSRDRASFGIPSNTFVVLVIANLSSNLARKNPSGAIQAFRAAFGSRTDVRLVLKIGDWHGERESLARQALEQDVRTAANILVITETLAMDDLAALIIASDCILSLHRAEGFGLVLAEAMLLERPVIATAWSGNLEFMTEHNSELIPGKLIPVQDECGIYSGIDAEWMDPDIEAAAGALRRLQASSALRRSLAARARTHDFITPFVRAVSAYLPDGDFYLGDQASSP